MPRIYTSQSDPLDFCSECFPSENEAEYRYANLGDGPDERGNCFGYDAEHPTYDDFDYHCEECGTALTSQDD